MEDLRAIHELLQDTGIPEGIYIRVCGHMKKVHKELSRKSPVRSTGKWRCFDLYPERVRELLRRILGISQEEAALLTSGQMERMTGLLPNELHKKMEIEMYARNSELRNT
jgi:hypothetical protein